jgi:hypothetical protein
MRSMIPSLTELRRPSARSIIESLPAFCEDCSLRATSVLVVDIFFTSIVFAESKGKWRSQARLICARASEIEAGR